MPHLISRTRALYNAEFTPFQKPGWHFIEYSARVAVTLNGMFAPGWHFIYKLKHIKDSGKSYCSGIFEEKGHLNTLIIGK